MGAKGCMNSYFFVTGQIGMKLSQKNANRCLKIFSGGVILPPNRHFGVDLIGLQVTG